LETFKVVFDGFELSSEQREGLQAKIEEAVRASVLEIASEAAEGTKAGPPKFVRPEDLPGRHHGPTKGLIGFPPELDPEQLSALAEREFGGA
jgi:hypothetical protein